MPGPGRALSAPCRAYEENGEGDFTSDLSGSMFDFFFSFFVPLSAFLARFFAFLDSLSFLAIVAPCCDGLFSFEVPRAVPTVGIALLLRRRVPHDAIECGHDRDGECRQRGDKDHSFGHVTILITASASAQTPIHRASTAIVPKVIRPKPVIASLIGASLLRSTRGTGLTVCINAERDEDRARDTTREPSPIPKA
jgi:hypothetical protein